MGSYFPMKLKRKDLDDVNDDFCDFSLSSPARKIRRLDAELSPIIEEEEMVNPVVFGQQVPSQDPFVSLPENEERAIILYDPMNNITLQSRSPFSFSVNSDFLSGFKNSVPWSNRSDLLKKLNIETENHDDNSEPNNGTLAVVPWVAPRESNPEMKIPQTEVYEMMDADDTETTTMDIEDDNSQLLPVSDLGVNQGQQYCMIPQAPHNLSTPIAWSGTGV